MIVEALYTTPAFEKLNDDYWAVGEDGFCADLVLSKGGGVFQFTLERGFQFNFRSGPRIVDPFVPKIDDGWLGYLIHDALYCEHNGLSRRTADEIMYQLHRMMGLGWVRSTMAHRAVRLFGADAWEVEDARQAKLIGFQWAPAKRRLMWHGVERHQP